MKPILSNDTADEPKNFWLYKWRLKQSAKMHTKIIGDKRFWLVQHNSMYYPKTKKAWELWKNNHAERVSFYLKLEKDIDRRKNRIIVHVDGDNLTNDDSYIKTGDIIELDAYKGLNDGWECTDDSYRKLTARTVYPYRKERL